MTQASVSLRWQTTAQPSSMKRHVQAGITLVADPQPAQVVQPGEGALHDPAFPAEPRAVLGAVAAGQGNRERDPARVSDQTVAEARDAAAPTPPRPAKPPACGARAPPGSLDQELIYMFVAPAIASDEYQALGCRGRDESGLGAQ